MRQDKLLCIDCDYYEDGLCIRGPSAIDKSKDGSGCFEGRGEAKTHEAKPVEVDTEPEIKDVSTSEKVDVAPDGTFNFKRKRASKKKE